MAEQDPQIPDLGEMLGLPSEELQRPDERGDLLDYFLGPTGIPDRLRAANELFNPYAESMRHAEFASREDLPPEQRREHAAYAASMAGIASLPLGKQAAALGRLIRGTLTPDPSGTTAGRAVVRRDDVFRGAGPQQVLETVSESADPFAIRVTGQSQIDDMIESGLVRPKPGGYGKRQLSTIYFGTQQDNTVNTASPFTRLGPGKEYAIVGRPEKIGAYEGGVPLDELEHVWTNSGDEIVDILPSLLRQNRQDR